MGRRRKQRGAAMLELALLLPVYMLVFFIVWTCGDIGLVSTQAHLGARYAAWRRTPDSAAVVMNVVGGGSLRARAMTGTVPGVVGYTRKPGTGYASESLRYWLQSDGREAYSARTYDLEAPLAWSGRRTPGGSVSFSEKSLDDALAGHAGHFLAPSEVADKLPVNAGGAEDFKYSIQMLAAAMEGDYSYGADMPWLQRRVAMTGLAMRGAAGITSREVYRSTHTVLLGARYYTQVPEYYAQVGSGVMPNGIDKEHWRDRYDAVPPAGRAKTQRNMLRNPAALRHEMRNNALTKGGMWHQMHFINARSDLKPPF